MSTDNLALLFRLRGDSTQLRAATNEARQAVAQLKQTFGPELARTVSTTNKAFSEVSVGLASVTQRIPVVGTAVTRLTDLLRGAGVESKTTERSLSTVANSIGAIARESGKSIPQVAQFLTRFTQLKTASDRNTEAFKFFGGSVDLIGNKTAKFLPQLDEAATALTAVSAESAAAGASIGAIALPITAAVIAVAALVAGLVLVSRELFNVTKQAADFQGKMQDLSQQTGVTVETLSTLEVAIATTGGNLNTVTQALVQFQRQMQESQDPLSKAAGNFEQLGVAVADTESTLRAALTALAAMPEGFQQTNAAAELFGSRGGKQVLALLKETNGDIDALQKRLRDTSILITTDAAQAADKFNDELALLNFQIRSLSAVAAEELIPAMTDLVRSFNELLQASKPLLGVIGALAGPTVRAAASSLRGLSTVVQVLTFDFDGLRKSIREAREEAAKGIPSIKVPEVVAPAIPQQTARQAAVETAQLAADAVAIAKRAASETAQALNAAFEQGRINRQQRVDDTIDSNRRVLEADKARIAAEIKQESDKWEQIRNRQDLADTEKQKLLEESLGKVRKLQQDELNAQSLFDTTSRELRARAAKERADSLRAERENETNLLTKEFDRQVAAIEARIAREGIAEEDGLTIIEQLERAKVEARREGLQRQQQIGFLTIEQQAEINRQIQQLDQEVDALEDAQQARREQRQRQHSERMRQLKLQELQTLLEVERITGESLIASIEAQAALRIRTEESASREILRIRLALLDDELEALKAEQTAAASIVGVNERTEALAEINARIAVLKAQRLAIESQGTRDIDAARQRDLDNERDYADDLREIQGRTVQAQRDAAEEVIRLMIVSGARRKDIIRAQRELDLAEEDDRHRRATESIRTQQQETDDEIRILEKRLERLKVGTTEEIEEHERLIESLERLRAKRAELAAQQEIEAERSRRRQEGITTEADREESDADPLGRLRLNKEQLQEFASELEATIVPLNQVLTSSFLQVAEAIGSVVEQWVLLGETGPAVMRKILAQALASIAKEAAINAIKELALGFAMLFINPAASASHFTSAALWGSIAGGAALAGRAAAGDLFKPKAGDTSSGSNGQGTGQLDPLRLNRNQPQPLQVTVVVQPDGTKFGEAITAHVLEDGRLGGPIRQFNIDDVVI